MACLPKPQTTGERHTDQLSVIAITHRTPDHIALRWSWIDEGILADPEIEVKIKLHFSSIFVHFRPFSPPLSLIRPFVGVCRRRVSERRKRYQIKGVECEILDASALTQKFRID